MKRANALGFAIVLLAGGSAAATERIPVFPGQPLCIDQTNLLAIMLASVQKDRELAKTLACEGMRPGSTAEVIERYPSGSEVLRMVKVRVTAPGRGPVTGFTVELDPN